MPFNVHTQIFVTEEETIKISGFFLLLNYDFKLNWITSLIQIKVSGIVEGRWERS